MATRISRSNVSNMFDSIAPTYDLMNHLLSFGVDRGWRRKTVKLIGQGRHQTIADFATGTGDLAIALAKKLSPKQIYGLDFSAEMLKIAKSKCEKEGVGQRVELREENCEHTTLADGEAEAVTCAFGIRNFNDAEQGLREMHRVLTRGGQVAILEFSTPRKGIVGALVRWYYMHVMPFAGKLIAGTKGAYTYLPKTILEFPDGERFCEMMRQAGFVEVGFRSLTFNMVNLYFGKKA